VKIYTRTGDRGLTGLLGGARVPKDAPRVSAYGDVDEANAVIGLAAAHADRSLARLLAGIQKDLFAIGARLADPTHKLAARRPKAAVTAARVRRLERAIDARERELPALRAFVLPGGTPLAALLHQARTVVRRAERTVVALSHGAPVEPGILVYLNRLSDLLFVLARHANHRAGLVEEHW
jgi:cob(I)alamin adenosyltransferase